MTWGRRRTTPGRLADCDRDRPPRRRECRIAPWSARVRLLHWHHDWIPHDPDDPVSVRVSSIPRPEAPMRLPRVRLTVRRLMLVVALAGLILGGIARSSRPTPGRVGVENGSGHSI